MMTHLSSLRRELDQAAAATPDDTYATEDPDTDMTEAELSIIPFTHSWTPKGGGPTDPSLDARISRTRAKRYNLEESDEVPAPKGGRKRAAAKPAPSPAKRQKQEPVAKKQKTVAKKQEPVVAKKQERETVVKRATRLTAAAVSKTSPKRAGHPKKNEKTPPVKGGGRRRD